METVLLFATILAPIVVALVELIKRTATQFPSNFIPLMAFVVGVLVGLVAYPFTDLDAVLRLWAGGFAGLAATGLFELGVKAKDSVTGAND